MKVIQLGNFRARVEAKYDEEIEEYRRKLEDSYQLCQQCQRHLNKTLNRIKTKFIGSKISQLVTKGIQIVGTPVTKKNRQIISKMAMVAVFVLSVVNLIRETNIDLGFLRSISHQYVITAYYHIVALFLTIVDLSKSLLNEMQLSYLTEINTDSIATSAVLLNSSILLSQKKVQLQIMLSMMFWSLKMILSELPIDETYILAVKGSLAGVLVLISIHMLFKSQEEKKPTVGPNGSFHKIAPQVQDDSDNEVETTDTSIINSSYAPALTRFKSCIREGTLLAPASTSHFAESLQGKSFHNSTVRRSATDGTRTMDMLSNRSFSIRQEVATLDRHQFHNEINKLNISGKMFGSTCLKDFNASKNLNPFSLANSRCGSPTPSLASVFSGSYRSQVISPPQLHTCPAEANTSWVAGGYWTTPQKRFLERNSGPIQPETSRSSSQSSGLGTFCSGKNSRDNSIHGDGDDTLSIFSQPVQRRNLFGKPADARSLYSQPFSPVLAPKVTTNFFFNTTACDFGKYRDGNSSFYK